MNEQTMSNEAAITREWLSPQELADWLGVPVKTVYVWRQTGNGPRAFKVGKHLRYRRADLESWLNKNADDA